MTKTILCAAATIAMLATACAAETGDAGTENANEAFAICIGAPAAAASQPWSTSGVVSTSGAAYGSACTKEYVLEAKATAGHPIAMEADLATVSLIDAATCNAITLIVQAWGSTHYPCGGDNGTCTSWTNLGKWTKSGIWTNYNGGSCAASAFLPARAARRTRRSVWAPSRRARSLTERL